MGRWSELPGELLHVIDGHLLLYIDKVRVRGICASWYSNLPKMPNQRLRQVPWLFHAFENGIEASHGLFNSFEQKFYLLDLPEAQGKLFKGSSHGWLVTIEDVTSSSPADLYLINPLTKARIQLPPRSTFPDVKDYHPDKVGEEYVLFCKDDNEVYVTNPDHLIHLTHKVVFSSTPSREDCIVVAIYGQSRRLAFCKCNDEKWTQLHVSTPYPTSFADVIFCKQKLYALSGTGRLMVIEEIGPNPTVTEIVAAGPSDPPCCPYLVECFDGELIMVSRDVDIRDGKGFNSIRETCDFQVYKLDLSSSSWVEVENVGEEMLFLGCNSSMSIPSCLFPGYKGNCIYYTDGPMSFGGRRGKQENSDIGVFRLDEGIFEELPGFKCEPKFLWPPAVWLMPPSLH
ncbi:hypothetical protein LguiB_032685 [Lonicera macranthoides]